ncbi:MAG: formate dehydrogenase accessory sulfurtransferase FdhD [Nevskia sp.]|nr:formate dehydrogenase accessory sulfurtransferase FdhD [Nevskia sp.]
MPSLPNRPLAMATASEPVAGYALLPVRAQRDGVARDTQDCVAEETPVALIVNGLPHVVMMATPADLEDFALGFVLSEAIVATASDVESLTVNALDNGYEIDLRIPAEPAALLADRRRNLVGRSGCGLCGSETIAEAMRPAPHVPAGLPISTAALHRALHELRERQPINAVTGATHAAAWADAAGKLLLVREDVGRHNALDKLIGAISREHIDSARGFAVITSRASYEMVLKAATVGMPLLAAISAPTALAVRMAEEAGLSLIGYARGGNHVIYACPARLSDTALLPITNESVSA